VAELNYDRRLDQLEQAGDENTLAAVVIARAALARVAELERQLAWHTGGVLNDFTPALNDFEPAEVPGG
jgi:hypothetical protein